MKIYYTYGTMSSSKTTNLLMVAHNYEAKGVKTHIVKPQTDTRTNEVTSKLGISRKPDFIIDNDNIGEFIKFVKNCINEDSVIFIDEAQFLKYDDIKLLVAEIYHYILRNKISKENFNIMAYGLLTDYNSNLFDGSRAWLEEADSIRNIKNVCAYCSRGATKNYLTAKYRDENTNIVIGDSAYKSLCSYHYHLLMDKNTNIREKR